MAEVKERIRVGFLEPIRHPELARAYGHSLRRSLLLWGPPGCGKTFLAKALAGELGVCFIPVEVADVMEMWVGQSERNVQSLFDKARQLAPSLLFIDEIDALGRRRTHMRFDSAGRNAVNQLLLELDGVDSDNSGLFVLAATNHPWDVDPALVRPGRFDQMVLVLPPDGEARRAILAYHLRDRPVGDVDLQRLAERTDGFSGADLAQLCQRATELVMHEAVRTGAVVKIEQPDLERALAELRPSTTEWLRVAKNVAQFAEDDRYDELARYIHHRRV
jgi:SpoVK/Ycf46/Vps4 family AAA+-type ATPase